MYMHSTCRFLESPSTDGRHACLRLLVCQLLTAGRHVLQGTCLLYSFAVHAVCDFLQALGLRSTSMDGTRYVGLLKRGQNCGHVLYPCQFKVNQMRV